MTTPAEFVAELAAQPCARRRLPGDPLFPEACNGGTVDTCIYCRARAVRDAVPPDDAGSAPAMASEHARVHDLKTWPDAFAAILDGRKPFEWRKNDRDFRVGDVLRLREWAPDADGAAPVSGYTGRVVERRVSYVLADRFGVPDGYCVMSIPVPPALPPARFEHDEAVYLDDCRDGNELAILADDQGDLYVSVRPEGQRVGPAVRLCASGGAVERAPGLLTALRMAWETIRAAAEGREPDPLLCAAWCLSQPAAGAPASPHVPRREAHPPGAPPPARCALCGEAWPCSAARTEKE